VFSRIIETALVSCTTVTIHQKGAYYDSIKVFNKMPEYIAESVKKKVLYQISISI
jgi:hypothetical protein